MFNFELKMEGWYSCERDWNDFFTRCVTRAVTVCLSRGVKVCRWPRVDSLLDNERTTFPFALIIVGIPKLSKLVEIEPGIGSGHGYGGDVQSSIKLSSPHGLGALVRYMMFFVLHVKGRVSCGPD